MKFYTNLLTWNTSSYVTIFVLISSPTKGKAITTYKKTERFLAEKLPPG